MAQREVAIFGVPPKNKNGDRLVAIIQGAAANQRGVVIAGGNPVSAGMDNRPGIAIIGGGQDYAALPSGRAVGPKEPGLVGALWEYLKFKRLTPIVDKVTTLGKAFQAETQKVLTRQDISSLIPNAEHVEGLVDIWEIVLNEASSGKLQPIAAGKQDGLTESIKKRAIELRKIKAEDRKAILDNIHRSNSYIGNIPIGVEEFGAMIENMAEKRSQDLMEGKTSEYPGPITQTEFNYATQLFNEWSSGAQVQEIEKLLYGYIRGRFQDIVSNSLKSQASINFRMSEEYRKALIGLRSTPVYFYADHGTSAALLDKKEAEAMTKMLWTIIPAGLFISIPGKRGMENLVLPWEQIAFGDEDRETAKVLLRPDSPPWIDKLRKSGASLLGPALVELNKIGGVIALDALTETDLPTNGSGAPGDNLGMIPVRDTEGVIRQMRRLRDLTEDLSETGRELLEYIKVTDREPGAVLRPNVIRKEFYRMRNEARQSQRDMVSQRLTSVTNWLTQHPNAKQVDLDKVKAIQTKLQRNLDQIDRGGRRNI